MKCFIKRTSFYAPKNRLYEALQKELVELDCTLHESREDAIREVERVFKETVDSYRGTAVRPKLQRYDRFGTYTIGVDCYLLSLYDVKNT